MKKFNQYEKNAIINVAKSAYAIVDKQEKTKAKKEELREKMEQKFKEKTADLDAQIESDQKIIDGLSLSLKDLIGEKSICDLVKRTVETSTNDEGKTVKKVRYTLVLEEAENVENVETSEPVTAPVEESVDNDSNDESETKVVDMTPETEEVETFDGESSENPGEIDPFED